LITEGDEGKAFFVLYKGKVAVTKKKRIFSKAKVAELGAGNFFGEMSLFSDDPCTATITAAEPVYSPVCGGLYSFSSSMYEA
jgi:CRP-like cAMP-binding protein